MGKLDKVLETADEMDWINVDMKRDWKRIFAFEKLGMRNMKKYITPKGGRTSRPAIAGIVTLILASLKKAESITVMVNFYQTAFS